MLDKAQITPSAMLLSLIAIVAPVFAGWVVWDWQKTSALMTSISDVDGRLSVKLTELRKSQAADVRQIYRDRAETVERLIERLTKLEVENRRYDQIDDALIESVAEIRATLTELTIKQDVIAQTLSGGSQRDAPAN